MSPEVDGGDNPAAVPPGACQLMASQCPDSSVWRNNRASMSVTVIGGLMPTAPENSIATRRGRAYGVRGLRDPRRV
jgi:hypothetical protein